MKTPMQELIDEMTYMLTEGERSIYALREKARKLLEKEKEVIKEAYTKGYEDGWDSESFVPEEYTTKPLTPKRDETTI